MPMVKASETTNTIIGNLAYFSAFFTLSKIFDTILLLHIFNILSNQGNILKYRKAITMPIAFVEYKTIIL